MGNTYSPRLFAPSLTKMPDDEVTSSINSGSAYTPTLSSISIGGARKVKAVSLGSLLKYLGTMGLASYAMNGDYYIEADEENNTIRLYPAVGSNLLNNYCPPGLVDGDRIRFKSKYDSKSSGDSSLGTMVSNNGTRYLEYFVTSPISSLNDINIRNCVTGSSGGYNSKVRVGSSSTSVDSGKWTSPPIKGVVNGSIIEFDYGSGYSSTDGLWDGNIKMKVNGLSSSYSLVGIYFKKLDGIYPNSIELSSGDVTGLVINLEDDYIKDPSNPGTDYNTGIQGYVHGSIDLGTQFIIRNESNIKLKVLSSYYEYGKNSNNLTSNDGGKLPLVDNSDVNYYQFNLSGVVLELVKTSSELIRYSSTNVDNDSNELNLISTNYLDLYNYLPETSLTPLNNRITNLRHSTRSENLGAFTTYFGSLGDSGSLVGDDIILNPTSNFIWRIYPYSKMDGTTNNGSFKVSKIVFTAKLDTSPNPKSYSVYPYQIKLTNGNNQPVIISYSSINESSRTATFNIPSSLEVWCTTDYDGNGGSEGINVLKLEIILFIDKTGVNDPDPDLATLGAKNFINYEKVEFYGESSSPIQVIILDLSPRILSGEPSGDKLSLFTNINFNELNTTNRNYGVLRDGNGTRKLFLFKSPSIFTELIDYTNINDIFYCNDNNIPCIITNIGGTYYLGKAYPNNSIPESGYIQGGNLFPISSNSDSVKIGLMYQYNMTSGNKIYLSIDYYRDNYESGATPSNTGNIIVVGDQYAVLDRGSGSYTYVYEVISSPDITTNGYNGITRSRVRISGTYYYYDLYDYIYYAEFSSGLVSKLLLMTGNDLDTIKYYNTCEYAMPFNPNSFELGSSDNPKSLFIPSVYSYKIVPGSSYNVINYDEFLTIGPKLGEEFINSITINKPNNPIRSLSGILLKSLFNDQLMELYYNYDGSYIKSLSNSIMMTQLDSNVSLKFNINIDNNFKSYERVSNTVSSISMIYPDIYYYGNYKLSLPNSSGLPLNYSGSITYDESLVKLLKISINSNNYHAYQIMNSEVNEFYKQTSWSNTEPLEGFVVTTENSKYYKSSYSYPNIVACSGSNQSFDVILAGVGSSKVKKINFTRYPGSNYPNKVSINGSSSDSWSAELPIGSSEVLLFNFDLPSSNVNIKSFNIMHGSSYPLTLVSDSGSIKLYTGSLSGRSLTAQLNNGNMIVVLGSGSLLTSGLITSNIIYNDTKTSGNNITDYGCYKRVTSRSSSEGNYKLYIYDIGSFTDDAIVIDVGPLGSSLRIIMPAGSTTDHVTISGKSVRWNRLSTSSMGMIYLTVEDESGTELSELNTVDIYFTPQDSVINRYISTTTEVVLNTAPSDSITVSINRYPNSSNNWSTTFNSSGSRTYNSLNVSANLSTGVVTIKATSGYVYGDITATSGSGSSRVETIGFADDNILTHVISFNPELMISNTQEIKLTFSDFRTPDGLPSDFGYLANISFVSESISGSSKYIEVYQGNPYLGYSTIPLIDSNNNIYKTGNGSNVTRAKLYRPIRYLGYDSDQDMVNRTLVDIVDGDLVRNNIYTIVYRNSYYDKSGMLRRLDEPYFELVDNSLNFRPTVDLDHNNNTYDYILPKVYQSGVVKVLTVTTSAGPDQSRVNRIFPWKDSSGSDLINEEYDVAFTSSDYKEGFATIMLMSYVHKNESGWSIMGGVNTWNKVYRPESLYPDCNNISGDNVVIMY